MRGITSHWIWILLGWSHLLFANTSPVYSETQKAIMVQAKQPVFTIQLQANRTTGYSWFLLDYPRDFIEPQSYRYEAPKTSLVGAGGIEWWTFRVKPEAFIVPQQLHIQFVYARPFESNPALKPLVFQIST